MRELDALLLTVAIAFWTFPGCQRTRQQPHQPVIAAPPVAAAGEPLAAPGEVGPLGSDCYDTKQAKACPPDPTDPSGRNLPAHGGPCHFANCRPCGSASAPAFRDEHGTPSSGFCICVPRSDSSGRATLSCYSQPAWKNGLQ